VINWKVVDYSNSSKQSDIITDLSDLEITTALASSEYKHLLIKEEQISSAEIADNCKTRDCLV
jgi:hypothetical protein